MNLVSTVNNGIHQWVLQPLAHPSILSETAAGADTNTVLASVPAAVLRLDGAEAQRKFF
ncbi:hypothetical protein BJ994_001147 [Arthrobacter pigmenti]|uniref:Uncharacterized protein n=1 Tax=Arthrobacter pigmenti TaxID=271432 RepID=A0A846RUX0_9MICC|nr:hypothetical protein [Arthrobacter pigmenti]NJC22071.1 hypothetical protein [Arthrobacter pigmenti]